MDLGSRLANLSLAEIASMLDSKQQEVLLASISVAARYIQQMQAEEQMLRDEEQMLRDEEQMLRDEEERDELPDDDDEDEDELDDDDDLDQQQQQLQQHQLQQLQQQHIYKHHHQATTTNNNNNNLNLSNQTNNTSTNSKLDNQQARLLEAAPSQIKDFAEELKHRRKLIRLSQKGAAQSLRAFTNGQQPCTDAIIYHFENLQLEPDRAIQLIPLLRDWLEWAEKHRLNGQQLPMMRAVTKVPRERKRKVVLFNEKAKQYLEDAFLKNNHPDRYQLDVISQELNIPTRSIRKWFTNRRQRKRFAEKFSSVS